MDVFKTPGAVSWTELHTSDPAAAASFYGQLFGWTIKDMGAEMGGYRVVTVGEAAIGGITAMPPGAPPMPPHWGSYVTVANVEQVLSRCAELGGKTLVPPMDIPNVGRMAVLQDPQGAVISVMAYNMPG
ncbi:MAG: VOC family protein [Burkholderiales bacterium]|nr:VOC family protein [Burkholderiales bacterium]MDE2397802.1 VOC family protein [Burkholderiales bacterium]MDE2454345.1 VOC family protein [Burkholderiales bacterium]